MCVKFSLAILLLAVMLKGTTCNPNILRSKIKNCYVCNSIKEAEKNCVESRKSELQKYKKGALKGALGYPLCFVVVTEYKTIARSADVERGAMGELDGRAEWKADLGRKGCQTTEDEDKKLRVCFCYTDACNWRSPERLDRQYNHMGLIVKGECMFRIQFLYLGLVFATFVSGSVIYCGLIGDKYSKKRLKLRIQEQASRRLHIITISEEASGLQSWTRINRDSLE